MDCRRPCDNPIIWTNDVLVYWRLNVLLDLGEFRSLLWRHNERDSVSNHQRFYCLLKPFVQTQIKDNIKAPRHWPLCVEFAGGEFHAQRGQ